MRCMSLETLPLVIIGCFRWSLIVLLSALSSLRIKWEADSAQDVNTRSRSIEVRTATPAVSTPPAITTVDPLEGAKEDVGSRRPRLEAPSLGKYPGMCEAR